MNNIIVNNMVSDMPTGIRTPAITSIETALQIFYTYPEIGNKEISQLFGKLSSATISKLKKAAKQRMVRENIYSYGTNTVNTKLAYLVWGIDIDDLEHRYKKLKELSL